MYESEKYIEHSAIQCGGVDIADTSKGNTPTRDHIWVGVGIEGKWLTSREVREVAAALIMTADAHDARMTDKATMPDYLAAMDHENS